MVRCGRGGGGGGGGEKDDRQADNITMRSRTYRSTPCVRLLMFIPTNRHNNNITKTLIATENTTINNRLSLLTNTQTNSNDINQQIGRAISLHKR